MLKGRTYKVAQRVTRWLRDNGRMSKAIVFCTGVHHAERMRLQLANLNRDIGNAKYVMRITGDDKRYFTIAREEIWYNYAQSGYGRNAR